MVYYFSYSDIDSWYCRREIVCESFSEFREAFNLKEKIKACLKMIQYFLNFDLKGIPATHRQHNYLIIRLRKLKKLLDRVGFFDKEGHWATFFDTERLQEIANILEAFRDEYKREREDILTFCYKWLKGILIDMLRVKFSIVLVDNYYAKAKIEAEIYTYEYVTREINEEYHFEVKNKKTKKHYYKHVKEDFIRKMFKKRR